MVKNIIRRVILNSGLRVGMNAELFSGLKVESYISASTNLGSTAAFFSHNSQPRLGPAASQVLANPRTAFPANPRSEMGPSLVGSSPPPEVATIPHQVTSGHLSAFREAVSVLFYQRGKEALPMALIRKHVLTTTRLTEPEIMACIKIMLNQNKMLETADFLCLV